MRIPLVLSIAGVSLAAGALVERVKAEQAFLCEGGRIVYARGAEVETLKLTDPCVAGYFGLKVEPGADRAAAPPKASAGVRANTIEVPAEAAPAGDAPRPAFRIINSRPEDEPLRTSSR